MTSLAVPACIDEEYLAHIFAFFRHPVEGAEIMRIILTPRNTPTKTELLGVPLEFLDGRAFLGMCQEIFLKKSYAFKSRRPSPYIIDGGANIGLSVLFFKNLYPDSTIVAFEADPHIFATLERNVRSCGYGDVDLRCQALAGSEGTLEYRVDDGGLGGRIAHAHDASAATIRVPTVRLRELLKRPVDFLKLDIEGAETDVIRDCADLLPNVDHLFVEYHSFAAEKQTLPVLMNIMADAGFRVHVHEEVTSPQPFLKRPDNVGMDLQLNIFAYREGQPA